MTAVLFDLDDTLYNRAPCVKRVLTEQLAMYRHKFPGATYEDFQQHFSGFDFQRGFAGQPDVYDSLLHHFGVTDISSEAMVANFRELLVKYIVDYDEGTPVLTVLRARKLKLGIVTNGPADIQGRKVNALELNAKVDAVLISGTEGIRKPDVEIFRRAAARLGVSPSDCWFVGDNPHADIYGAKMVGMQTVWIPRGQTWPDDLDIVPDHTISKLDEIQKLI